VKKLQSKVKKSPKRPQRQTKKKKLRPVREERKKKITKEGMEVDDNDDDEEEDQDVFFEAIKRGKCSLNNLMVEWRERYLENEKDATCEVLNFVLQSCGGQGECVPSTESLDKLDMADLVEYVLDDLEKTNEEYPIASTKQKVFKKFHSNFVDFWKAFIKECYQSEILFQSQSIVERFVDWLTSLSSAEIRAIRHTTTIAAYAIGTALVECAISIQEQLVLVKRQLEAEEFG
jgi:cohesin complex subunit SA-1/2